MSSSTVSVPATVAVASVPLWINGQYAASHSTRHGVVSNPATGETIRAVPLADAADVDAAVKAAVAAFPAWRATPPLRRARILNRFRELVEQHQKELAALVSEEHGKVFLDAMGSVQRGLEVVEFAAGAPQLLKGDHAESVGRGVDAHSRLPWSRCGCSRWPWPAGTPSS
jgi:malonate-semialdehyde dehydrogenase (acetylating)/methylmalonate-semialdehyde dehydrogenase